VGEDGLTTGKSAYQQQRQHHRQRVTGHAMHRYDNTRHRFYSNKGSHLGQTSRLVQGPLTLKFHARLNNNAVGKSGFILKAGKSPVIQVIK
jgi:hypothetical protein